MQGRSKSIGGCVALPRQLLKMTGDDARRLFRARALPCCRRQKQQWWRASAGLPGGNPNADGSREMAQRRRSRSRKKGKPDALHSQRIRAAKPLIKKPAVLAEHARVKAVSRIDERDESVPAITGTVVHVIRGGVGYDVEFTLPRHVVISATRDELALA